jgi:hypothetical protein
MDSGHLELRPLAAVWGRSSGICPLDAGPLLQWFEMGAKSDAIAGAFSYPDTTKLPHSAFALSAVKRSSFTKSRQVPPAPFLLGGAPTEAIRLVPQPG